MKQQIVKRFLEQGVLLTPEALEKITEGNLESALSKAAGSKEAVFSFQAESHGPAKLAVEVRKLQKRAKLSPQDFAAYYNARFEGLRGMLQKKMDGVVSVANAKKSGSAISTIGMVREQTQRGFLIEDTTGSAEVISKAVDVAPDDVIGVKAAVKEGTLFAEEILWPDIPMSRENNRPELGILLAEKDGHHDEFVITPEAVYADRKRTALPNPGWITITSGGAAVAILVYRPEKPATQREVLAWLKKRHLCPDRGQIRGTDDPFLIEPIPDLVWIVQADKWNESYKGVIIVSSDGKVPAEANMAAGKITFQD